MILLYSFQSLNVKYKARVPVILMNSFNTDDDTKRIIQKYNQVSEPWAWNVF